MQDRRREINVSRETLKYPLVLVHGAGFRDKTMGINYWGRIPAYLKKEGLTVHYGKTDAWGTVESNGEILKHTILDILAETGAEKVNIIAHSKGGLEARYAAHFPGMESKIASITTMAAPHRGTKAMNVALKFPDWLYRFAALCVDTWCESLGDWDPDFYQGSRQLAEKWCSAFNKDNPDRPEIYYQSFAVQLKFFFGDLLYLLPSILVNIFDGPNDGLCPAESAKWGNYRGLITARGFFGISHGGILDLYHLPYRNGLLIPPDSKPRITVSIPELYVLIVRELAGMGF
jgi:triacylglycerol lipase